MLLSAYANATSYTENVMGIKNINTTMTYNAVHATDKLCQKLKFLVLQTGTNVSYTFPSSFQFLLTSYVRTMVSQSCSISTRLK